MPFGDWWTNWGFTSSGAQTAAGNEFLRTGNVGTPIGGTTCRGSGECASGYACVDGSCVFVASLSSEDGSTTGCGGSGGGGGGCFDSSTGCTTPSCGNGEGGDCCGPRYCRFDQNGNVSCGCGVAPPSPCSVFCSLYDASYGQRAAGCEGLVCDECSACDNDYFASTYGSCVPSGGGPCHCTADSLPECYKCNDQGTSELDLNCKQCVQIYNAECSCGKIIDNVCCYTLKDLKGRYGGDPVTRCQDETAAKCAQACEGEPSAEDPCEGECTEQKIGPLPGTCQDVIDQISVADGHKVVGTGCIEAGGQATVLYNDCDVSNVPEECAVCDCNCNNDCPDCLLCGADGKCYPDPACENLQARATLLPYFCGSTLTSTQCQVSGQCTAGGTTTDCSCGTATTLWGKPPFTWKTLSPSSGGTAFTTQPVFGFPCDLWTSNPDFVDGSWVLVDADDNTVYGPVGSAFCGCLNCCNTSTVNQNPGAPAYTIASYEYQ